MIRTLHSTRRPLVAVALLLACPAAAAMDLTYTHTYGELVDRGSVTVHVSPTAAWDCSSSANVDLPGKRIRLTGGAATPGPPINCFAPWTALLPPLPASRYEVTARLVAANGAVVESVTKSLEILPLEGRCNPDPALSPSIMSKPREPAAAFVARANADPAFRAALGNPAIRLVDYQAFDDEVHFDYPPLDDIPPAMDRLASTGLLEWLGRNGRACFAAPAPDMIGAMVEFHHAGLDHYFYSGDPGEIAAIDAGSVGAWTRTGRSFRVVVQPGCEFSSTDKVVYRFNGVPGKGPSSHFFTRDRAECYAVDKRGLWALEGIPFFASPPAVDGACASARVPLYRVWRPFGETNHRFTTERSVVSEMVARGWVDEGVAMCVLPSS